MVTTSQSIGAPVAHQPEGTPDNVVVITPDAAAVTLAGEVTVTMRAKITGTRNGVDWPEIGGDITLPAEEAASLIRNSLAILSVREEQPEEAAVAEAPAEEAATEPVDEETASVEEQVEAAVKPRKRR